LVHFHPIKKMSDSFGTFLHSLGKLIVNKSQEDLTKVSLDENIIKTCSELLKNGVYENMDIAKFKDTLKVNTLLSSDQKKQFLQFWMDEKDQLHNQVVSDSRFAPYISNIKWRIDQLTNVKEVTENSQIVSVVELTKKHNGIEKSVLFEVDKEQLGNVVEKLLQIQNKINTFAS
jgi:hypothetical protein